MIPLSIVLKKGTRLDGSHPTILGGYGAYAISMDPYFDPRLIAWLEHGGIMATAHVRGEENTARSGIKPVCSTKSRHLEGLHRLRGILIAKGTPHRHGLPDMQEARVESSSAEHSQSVPTCSRQLWTMLGSPI